MKRKWLFGLVVAALVVGITLAGCAPTPEVTPPAEEEAIIIPWGTASCLSGPYAAWGMEEHYLQEILIEDLNTGGGCWGGILGHEPGFRVKGQLYNWKIIAYDARMDPAEGVKVVSRLIYEDKCNFIHVFMDQVYLAARTMFLENKTLVTVQGDSPEDLGPDNPRTFRTLLSNPDINPRVYAPWIADNLEVESVAFIAEDSEMCRLHTEHYKKQFNTLGVDIVGEEYYETGATDYTAPLSKLKVANPDMIHMPHQPSEEVGLIVKQARELGYEGIMFEGVCPATPTLVDLAGWDALEGLYSVNAVSQPFPYSQQEWFYGEYTERYGVDAWSGGLFDRCDDPFNLTLAIEKANSLDTDAVTKAFESLTSDEVFSFFGPGAYMGGETIYGNNHILIPRHWVSMITGGKEINVAEILPPSGL